MKTNENIIYMNNLSIQKVFLISINAYHFSLMLGKNISFKSRIAKPGQIRNTLKMLYTPPWGYVAIQSSAFKSKT